MSGVKYIKHVPTEPAQLSDEEKHRANDFLCRQVYGFSLPPRDQPPKPETESGPQKTAATIAIQERAKARAESKALKDAITRGFELGIENAKRRRLGLEPLELEEEDDTDPEAA